MSLLDKVIEQTIDTQGAHKRLQPFLAATGQSYDRIAAQLREAMIRVPKIAQCDPDTIIDAVVTIQRWQLEIGETAFLVPYKNSGRLVCTPVRGYRGDIEILINNGVVRSVEARTVYEGEHFVYEEGLSPKLEHHPLPPSKRGDVIGAYAIAWLTRSHAVSKFLWQEEIEEHREEFSKQWNAQTVGECPKWYGRKCAVKAATNLLPKTPKLRGIIEQMNEDEVVAGSTRKAMPPRPANVTADGELVDDQQETSTPPKPAKAAKSDNDRECPKCGGDMWDNRMSKTNPKQPDFKCKDRGCDGVVWPPRTKANGAPPVSQGALPIDDERAPAGTNALAHP
jgi:phage RecT family recombinase